MPLCDGVERDRDRVRVARSAFMHEPKAPTPGSTMPSAPFACSAVGDELGLGADVDERLVDRAEVADAVVEDRDTRGHKRALGRRDPRAFDAHGVAQRPGHALEARLDDVMRVLAAAWRGCAA